MTAATLKRRLVELESKTNDQDNELEVLHVLRERLREAGQLHDNADKMTVGELTLHALRWKHRDTK